MILEHLTADTTLESLIKKVKGLEVDTPDEDDYDPGLWPEMKSKRFISTVEKIKGHEGLWQLSFKNGLLFFIQFNIEFGSKSENAYHNCMEICRAIVKVNNSLRGMREMLTVKETKSYQDVKNEVLSSSSLPHDRFVQFANYNWRNEEKFAYLSASLTWPDCMSVEYREEPV